MHTEDAAGRHRRGAIESSVVRPMSTVRTPVRGKQTARVTGEQSGKVRPELTDHKAVPATEHRDEAWEPGAGGRRPGGTEQA
jgi:hypothetical protein